MKTHLLGICCFSIATFGVYADDTQAQMQALKGQLEQLVEIDRKIEGLEKQKLQYKASAAQELERGSFAILPRAERRATREADEAMQNIQNLNQQIEQLNQQRDNIMMALK